MKKILFCLTFVMLIPVFSFGQRPAGKERAGVVVEMDPSNGHAVIKDLTSGERIEVMERPNVQLEIGDEVIYILVTYYVYNSQTGRMELKHRGIVRNIDSDSEG